MHLINSKALLITLLLTVLLNGCGRSDVTMSGQIYLDQQPITIEAPRSVKLSFVPLVAEETMQPYLVTADSTGLYRLSEIPPGRYRVEVSDFEEFPYNNGLASYFRNNPKAITMTLPTEDPSIHISSDWYAKSER